MPLATLAACAALALLAVGADAVEEDAAYSCSTYGESCAAEGDAVSLIQSRNLLSRRSAPPPYKGPFASRRSCRNIGGGSAQCFPDIMLVGASKAGTSSVTEALKNHPSVDIQTGLLPDSLAFEGGKGVNDEMHLFDYHLVPHAMMTTLHWATAPTVPESRVGYELQLHYTPNYMYFPDAPFNIYDVYPNVHSIKYLFMVRDPTQRAVSSWKFHRQITMEIRPFDMVVSQGMRQRRNLEACYKDQLQKMNKTARYVEDLSIADQLLVIQRCFWGKLDTHDLTTPPETPLALAHAHVDKGIYADQLRRWFSVVGRENCFVFSLEEWAANETDVYLQIMNFTGLPAVGQHGFKDVATLTRTVQQRINANEDLAGLLPEPPTPEQSLLDQLDHFYKPYNEELFKLVGRRLY